MSGSLQPRAIFSKQLAFPKTKSIFRRGDFIAKNITAMYWLQIQLETAKTLPLHGFWNTKQANWSQYGLLAQMMFSKGGQVLSGTNNWNIGKSVVINLPKVNPETVLPQTSLLVMYQHFQKKSAIIWLNSLFQRILKYPIVPNHLSFWFSGNGKDFFKKIEI